MLKRKRKDQASIITKTLDAQISKRQQYVEAERKKKADIENQVIEDNERYLETRKSLQQGWKAKAKLAMEQDLERRRMLSSMQAPL